jgi:hypothetical protein
VAEWQTRRIQKPSSAETSRPEGRASPLQDSEHEPYELGVSGAGQDTAGGLLADASIEELLTELKARGMHPLDAARRRKSGGRS